MSGDLAGLAFRHASIGTATVSVFDIAVWTWIPIFYWREWGQLRDLLDEIDDALVSISPSRLDVGFRVVLGLIWLVGGVADLRHPSGGMLGLGVAWAAFYFATDFQPPKRSLFGRAYDHVLAALAKARWRIAPLPT